LSWTSVPSFPRTCTREYSNMGLVQNIAFLSGLVALLDAEVLLLIEDAIVAVGGQQVGSIAIGDNMHFDMDVTINSLPSGDWASVFQCGTSNDDRYPGIFVNDNSGREGHAQEGFYVVVSGGGAHATGDALAAGQTYHVDVDYTQNWWVVRVDGETVVSVSKSAHSTRDSVPCYVSANFLHGNADVLIENLVVSTDIGCYFTGFECDDHLVCQDDGECGRDCAEFPVDEWLLDCSAEFGENENDIATLQSSIVAINGDIDTIQNTLSSKADNATTTALQASVDGKADTATTDALQAAIDAINSRLDKLTLSAHSVPAMVDGAAHLDTDSMKWTLTGKDIAIIALLAVNLLIMVTLFVVCRTGSGGKYVYGQ